MREIRLHKQHSPPCQSKPVQPKELALLDRAMAETVGVNRGSFAKYVELDADGNPIYEEE